MDFFLKLEQQCKKKNSLLCVGLDPALEGISAKEAKSTIIMQNKKLIEATIDYAVCYKPNIAFYEAWGSSGLDALKETLSIIPKDIPILLDAKRGDIGNTASAYARSAFSEFEADAITLSPYMGYSSAKPFFDYQDKGFFFLCRTSNDGASQIQEELDALGNPLYMNIAKNALSWAPSRVGLVVAGNEPTALRQVRQAFKNVWLLAPGIGAQGGSMEEAIDAGLRDDGLGLLPVVVRAIAKASDPKVAAREFVEQLNRAREIKASKKSAGGGLNSSDSALKQNVLKGLIETECFRLGEFTLKSGKLSPFYVDLRRTSASPTLMKYIGMAYWSLMKDLEFDHIAGIPVAALPLATAASLVSGKPLIYPRITQKDHGSGNKIEGNWKPGDKVLLLDDLITTGKSKIEAIQILRDAGLIVEDLVVLLERGVQGRLDMEAANVKLHAFAPVQELFRRCRELNLIDEQKEQELIAYTKEA